MRILSICDIEDCLDASIIRDYILNESINNDFIQHLGKLGKMRYFASFARPFFQIDKDGEYNIKGVEGDQSFRTRLYPPNIEDKQKRLIEHVTESNH